MPNSNVDIAFTSHLGGAAFALAYFHFRWNLGRVTAPVAEWVKGHSRPSLKVFKPDDDRNEPVADEEVSGTARAMSRPGPASRTRKGRTGWC